MSKPTALHTEGTAQVLECLNISDTAKKLYKMEAQCKGGVRNDVVASIVAAGERRGLLRMESRT